MANKTTPTTLDAALKAGERPTLKTIAKLTGLAVATVSRALSDAPDIGEDTKIRVRETADRIGYRPNRAGVRLRTGKTNVISLVMSTDHDMMNHTARLISSVAATLHGTAYHMIMTPYFPTEDPMKPVKYLVETGSADGIILNQTEPEDPRVRYLMDRDFPFATHGRTDWADQHPYFDFDNRVFVEIAVKKLASRGRKCLLLALPPQNQNYTMDMLAGAEEATKQHGMAFQVLEGTTANHPAAEVEAAIRAHVLKYPEVDAVLASATAACMAIATAVEAVGREIGADIDIVGKEAIPFLKLFREPILTVFEDVAKAGEFCTRATMQKIDAPDLPPMQFLEKPTKVF